MSLRPWRAPENDRTLVERDETVLAWEFARRNREVAAAMAHEGVEADDVSAFEPWGLRFRG